MRKYFNFFLLLASLFPPLAQAADEPIRPVETMFSSTLPETLALGFQSCQSKDEYIGPAEWHVLRNKTLMTGCVMRHRIIAALAESKELRARPFVCKADIRLAGAEVPLATAKIDPASCDVEGRRLVEKLSRFLSSVKFDALDPEIGEWIIIQVELRSSTATDRKLVNVPWAMTEIRQGAMEYRVSSGVLTFANAANLPPLPPPPGPNCTNCASGMSIAAARPVGDGSSIKSMFWRRSVSMKVSEAIANDQALWGKLKKKPYSFDAKLYINPDHQIVTADIMQASGAAKKLVDQIRAAILSAKLASAPKDGPDIVIYFGKMTIRISRR